MCRAFRRFILLVTLAGFVVWEVSAAAIVEECIPKWASLVNGNVIGECPYGIKLPGDVTWSYDLHDESPVEHLLCVAWGYIPYVVVLSAICELLAKRGTRELQFVAFVGFTTGLNEFVFKHLVKQARPEGSCLHTCGMPSGHSTMSVGFATLMFLDLSFRICPTNPKAVRQMTLEKLGRSKSVWEGVKAYVTFLPISNATVISNGQFIRIFLLWFAVLVPVPASRVMLRDHTIRQVALGSMIGCLEACLWFFISQRLAQRYHSFVGREWPVGWKFHVLRHDFTVPIYDHLVEEVLVNPEAQKSVLKRVNTIVTLSSSPNSCANLSSSPVNNSIGSGGSQSADTGAGAITKQEGEVYSRQTISI
eukprot:gnl/TRDRNA2_/TRDRNA2_31721_c0_seq1.p1 gnl/TRDRNA2_/TRDRNA2_31721_c0~~gnl/TRDRNA2_/TRDRNA2_31721_c0_seq1.p1  ORF type:complete len:363 (-),score=23.39 gnl/TRDRNA2_/TRDRNA2_31721_c0_seq1:75-1163(-)